MQQGKDRVKGGFDAVVVSVHMAWGDLGQRDREKAGLRAVAEEMALIDPDVIIACDFNTTEVEMEALADEVGMVLMVPAGQDGQGTTHANNRYDHFLISFDLADEEALSSRIITYGEANLALADEVSDHLRYEPRSTPREVS